MTSIATRNLPRARSGGFTLIELMISMLLGLLIVGSVMGVMLANKRSYSTNEGLAQVQESARTAYELLAHDIRQADGNGCVTSSGADARVANVLVASGLWWQDWTGVRGYDSTQVDPAVTIGAAANQRVAGTDSIRVQSMDGVGLAISNHDTASRKLDITVATAPDFVANDIMLVCDTDHATVFQASAVSTAAGITSVFHNLGTGPPANCTQGLGFPTSCATTAGNAYRFLVDTDSQAQIGRVVVTDWYIGNSAIGSGRSLFRWRGGAAAPEEIVSGVTNMQLRFRATGDVAIIPNATAVPDWSLISSVLIQLTAQSSDANVTVNSALNSGRVERTFNYLISLRNRLP